MGLKEQIDPNRLPEHIAIIMDGNGRWAKERGEDRLYGHLHGVESVRNIVEGSAEAGIRFLTLYAFSTENWSRPRAEVQALMRLFEETIDGEIDELHENGIQVRVIGRRDRLGDSLRRRVEQAEQLTAHNRNAILNVAINYGGRSEIVDGVRDLAARGEDLGALDEAMLSRSLYTAGLPDPDLIIRTAGEMRVSNFLLWQAAYAELHVTDTLWPDFGARDLEAALADFAARERKFGAVDPAGSESESTAPVAFR